MICTRGSDLTRNRLFQSLCPEWIAMPKKNFSQLRQGVHLIVDGVMWWIIASYCEKNSENEARIKSPSIRQKYIIKQKLYNWISFDQKITKIPKNKFWLTLKATKN